MTVSLAATAPAAMPPSGGAGGLQASQNLFEHMASSAKSSPAGAGPHQIGDGLIDRLNSFIDRSRDFSKQADQMTNGAPAAKGAPAVNQEKPVAAQNASAVESPKKVGELQIDQIVQSMGKMFDYSIETQMVVRGATQISGSANTLLKGQ